MSLVFIALFTSVPVMAQVVSTDFEDGTTDGWFPFGNPTVAASNAQANTGSFSLLTTNRTQSFEGPGINLTQALTAGQSYVFRLAARIAQSQTGSASLQMTMLSVVNGVTGYTGVASATATTGGWTILQGTYTPPSSGVSQLILYVEAPSDSTASYYIDSFSVSGASGGCSNPPDTSGFSSNFEDGTAQGWGPRGGELVNPTQADAHSGAWSLLTTGRTQFWNGPTHDITGKMCNGSQYWLEAWVKLAPGETTTTINMSLQLTDEFGNPSYPSVTSATVTSGAWVRLKSKPYTFSGSYANLQLYFQSGFPPAPVSQFYLDDVKV
jgi:endo-1,4-beta-xylanase